MPTPPRSRFSNGWLPTFRQTRSDDLAVGGSMGFMSVIVSSLLFVPGPPLLVALGSAQRVAPCCSLTDPIVQRPSGCRSVGYDTPNWSR